MRFEHTTIVVLENGMKTTWYSVGSFTEKWGHAPADDKENKIEGERRSIGGVERVWFPVTSGNAEIWEQKTVERYQFTHVTCYDHSSVGFQERQQINTWTSRSEKLMEDLAAKTPGDMSKMQVWTERAEQSPAAGSGSQGGWDGDGGRSVMHRVQAAGRDRDNGEDVIGHATPPHKKNKTHAASAEAALSADQLISNKIELLKKENRALMESLKGDSYRTVLTPTAFASVESKLESLARQAKTIGDTPSITKAKEEKSLWKLLENLLKAYDDFQKSQRGKDVKMQHLLTIYIQVEANPDLIGRLPSSIEEVCLKALATKQIKAREIQKAASLASLERLEKHVGDEAMAVSGKLLDMMITSHAELGPAQKGASEKDVTAHMLLLFEALGDAKKVRLAPCDADAILRMFQLCRVTPLEGKSDIDDLIKQFEGTSGIPMASTAVASFLGCDAKKAVLNYVKAVNQVLKANARSQDVSSALRLILAKLAGDDNTQKLKEAAAVWVVEKQEELKKICDLLHSDTMKSTEFKDVQKDLHKQVADLLFQCQKHCLHQWSKLVHETTSKMMSTEIIEKISMESLTAGTADLRMALDVFAAPQVFKTFTKFPAMTTTSAISWSSDVCSFIVAIESLNTKMLSQSSLSHQAVDYETALRSKMEHESTSTSSAKCIIRLSLCYEKLFSWKGKEGFEFDGALKASSKNMPDFLKLAENISGAVAKESDIAFTAFKRTLPDKVDLLKKMEREGVEAGVFDELKEFLPVAAQILASESKQEIMDSEVARGECSEEKMLRALLIIRKDLENLNRIELRWAIAKARVKFVGLLHVLSTVGESRAGDSSIDLQSQCSILHQTLLQPAFAELQKLSLAKKNHLDGKHGLPDGEDKAVLEHAAKWITSAILSPGLRCLSNLVKIGSNAAAGFVPGNWESLIVQRASKDIIQIMCVESYYTSFTPLLTAITEANGHLAAYQKLVLNLTNFSKELIAGEVKLEMSAAEQRCKQMQKYGASVLACTYILKKWPPLSKQARAQQANAFSVAVDLLLRPVIEHDPSH